MEKEYVPMLHEKNAFSQAINNQLKSTELAFGVELKTKKHFRVAIHCDVTNLPLHNTRAAGSLCVIDRAKICSG